jgi:ABC-type polar amino acid transport system ATPase subunit
VGVRAAITHASGGVMLLDVAGLAIRRGGRELVRDVTFTAARGDVVALMGASGTGKTTILRTIAGLEPVAAERVVIDGMALTAGAPPSGPQLRELHMRVGMVFQFHHLFAHLDALENVWLAPVHVRGLARAEAERQAQTLLDRLGVGGRARARPHELSGGEAQRVAIARALAMDPALLLMDEPTASLDAARRGELAATLRELAGGNRAIVVATHDLEFARACATRVLTLADGRVE